MTKIRRPSRKKKRHASVFDLFETETWMSKGLCVQPEYDPDDWFTHNKQKTENAIMLCKQCPVRRTCRNYALNWDGGTPLRGIWGATDEDLRLRVNKRRQVLAS